MPITAASSSNSCTLPASAGQILAALLGELPEPGAEQPLPIGEAREIAVEDLSLADRAALIEAATAAQAAHA